MTQQSKPQPVIDLARKLVERVEFDITRNGGLTSDDTLRKAGELRLELWKYDHA